jgi:hypothetical protein
MDVVKRLPSGDRERLAEAFYDLAKSFDQANEVWTKVLVLQIKIADSVRSGTDVNDFNVYQQIRGTSGNSQAV